MSGEHIDQILVDETPGGLTTPEIVNWAGHVLSTRRSHTSVLTNRRELSGTCVYLLLGEDEDGVAHACIGETDDFVARRTLHQRLVADGSILIDGSIGRVTRDIVFSSPSTAGAIVEGRSCNGQIAWVSNEGSFGQWESRGIDVAIEES